MSLDALLNALNAVGTVVDTPASVFRGLLSGQPGRALGGVLDPSQRVHGEEITGDPYTGFALDLAADPLNLLGGLGLFKTAKAAKAAKASNRARQALLDVGAMPEEIAKMTVFADEAGPARMYHGTPHAFNKLRPHATDWAKGVFMSPDPEVAADYSKLGKWQQETMQGRDTALRPNIHMRYIDSRNPLDIEGPMGEIYHDAVAELGVEGATKKMQDAGYDSLVSRLVGSEHPEIIVFGPSQLYSPWVAPAAQRVPSTSPLLAALGAYNAGRTGAYI